MKSKIIKMFWILVTLAVSGILFVLVVISIFAFGLPKIDTLSDYRPAIPSQILSRDGTVLASIGKEKRKVATFGEIPKIIVDAFLSAEDDNFYKHKGVDYMGILRAMLINLKEGKVAQGGSTITQQVAKSLLLTRERSYSRKIKDILLAQRIEKKFSKEEILFLYLNQVYLGGGNYGVKNAFSGYFGKELSEASVAESAMIAGLLVAPGKYSPYVNPGYAKKRQQYVLNRMLTTNKITTTQYEQAKNEKIKYRIRKNNLFKAGYFTDWVRQRVIDVVGEENFLTNGFKVLTTLDWELQQVAEKESLLGAEAIDKRQGFKGPIETLDYEDREVVDNFFIEFRKKVFNDKSQYFTISDKQEKEFELVFNEELFYEVQQYQSEWIKQIRNKRFQPGIFERDSLVDLLDFSKKYQAVVTKIDDWARIIYVSIGGVPGIIPFEQYRWAHERFISENRNYASYVYKPSSILKKGDVVLVSIQKKSVGVWRYLNKPFAKFYAKNKEIGLVKKEKFLLCLLDQVPDAQVALFSVSPKTGEVLSLVGGTDFKKSQFNRALQSKRQPGSSFKPILYAAGLENGFTPASIIIDSPEALGSADENLNWKPGNYDGKFLGEMTFRKSLEKSRNVPTIKMAEKIKVPVIIDFVKRIGIDAELDRDLSLALGSFGVTLMDIVSAYALFPNGGRVVDVKSIISVIDREGNSYEIPEKFKSDVIKKRLEVEEQEKLALQEQEKIKQEVLEDLNIENNETDDKKVKKELEVNPYHLTLGESQVYDSRLAYLMTNLLRGVIQYGTGRSARDVSQFIGGKTGTTNSYVDAWFIGFSSNLALGVWTGFDDNKTLGWGETGAKSALPIWKEYMKAGLKKFGEHDFRVPTGIVNVMIDKETGKLAGGDTSNAFMEAFVEGSEPRLEEDFLVNEDEDIKQADLGGTILEDDEYYNNQ